MSISITILLRYSYYHYYKYNTAAWNGLFKNTITVRSAWRRHSNLLMNTSWLSSPLWLFLCMGTRDVHNDACNMHIFPFNFLPHFLWITLQYISLVSSVVLVGIFVSIVGIFVSILLKSLYFLGKASYGLFSSVFGFISLVQRNQIMPNLLTELGYLLVLVLYISSSNICFNARAPVLVCVRARVCVCGFVLSQSLSWKLQS